MCLLRAYAIVHGVCFVLFEALFRISGFVLFFPALVFASAKLFFCRRI